MTATAIRRQNNAIVLWIMRAVTAAAAASILDWVIWFSEKGAAG